MVRLFKDINARVSGLLKRETSEKDAPQLEREAVITSQADRLDETQAKGEDGVVAEAPPAGNDSTTGEGEDAGIEDGDTSDEGGSGDITFSSGDGSITADGDDNVFGAADDDEPEDDAVNEGSITIEAGGQDDGVPDDGTGQFTIESGDADDEITVSDSSRTDAVTVDDSEFDGGDEDDGSDEFTLVSDDDSDGDFTLTDGSDTDSSGSVTIGADGSDEFTFSSGDSDNTIESDGSTEDSDDEPAISIDDSEADVIGEDGGSPDEEESDEALPPEEWPEPEPEPAPEPVEDESSDEADSEPEDDARAGSPVVEAVTGREQIVGVEHLEEAVFPVLQPEDDESEDDGSSAPPTQYVLPQDERFANVEFHGDALLSDDDDDDEVSKDELIEIPPEPENLRAPGEGPPNPQPKGPEDTGVAAMSGDSEGSDPTDMTSGDPDAGNPMDVGQTAPATLAFVEPVEAATVQPFADLTFVAEQPAAQIDFAPAPEPPAAVLEPQATVEAQIAFAQPLEAVAVTGIPELEPVEPIVEIPAPAEDEDDDTGE